MPSFTHILFPVDFSEQNIAIAPQVASLAGRHGAQVTLLHVMEMPALPYPGWPAFDFQTMANERKERLGSFLQEEFQSLATKRVMQEGDPASLIVDYAEKEKVDLIMMPTHGYGPFRRFLLGSVTAKVLHDANCPVWTSAHAPETPKASAAYACVLCAVDLTSKSLSLVQWASGLASEHKATLKLVHAIPSAVPTAGIDIEGGRFRAFSFDAARKALAKLQQAAGSTLDTVLEAGEIAAVVREAAQEKHADLIVVGRGVMQETFGLMRTSVYSIVREAPCPVISVPRVSVPFEATESYYS